MQDVTDLDWECSHFSPGLRASREGNCSFYLKTKGYAMPSVLQSQW